MKCFIAIVIVACFAIAAADKCFDEEKSNAKRKEMNEKIKAVREECGGKPKEDQEKCYMDKFKEKSWDDRKSDVLELTIQSKKKIVEDAYNSCAREEKMKHHICIIQELKDKCDEFAKLAKILEKEKKD